MSGFQLRSPKPADLQGLTDLCMRSKAHWGFDANFMSKCLPIFTYTSDDLAIGHWAVEQNLLGMVHIVITGQSASLDKLFIDPAAIGKGLGHQLFHWAETHARGNGASVITIVADPNAVGFYERVGAELIGQHPSDAIPGRMLPVLEKQL